MFLLKISLEHSKGNNCTVRGSSIREAYARGFMQLLNKALLGFLDKIQQTEKELSRIIPFMRNVRFSAAFLTARS